MATLNTLRTRGGVIVSVVIGIALLAFLVGDFLSSGGSMMNANKMRVGVINGSKIGYIEYSNRMDYLTNVTQTLMNKEALSNEEQENVKNLAWQDLIFEYAFKPGLESSGILVSEAEQVDMVDGTYISPAISSLFVNPQTGIFDPNMLRMFVANLGNDPSGRANALWLHLKNQMNQQRMMTKYSTLISKGIYVTDLEVEQGLANANSTSGISYIAEDYEQIPDSTVNVTESEVRKYYSEHRNLFRQSASRDIEYVVFNVLPSEQDYADAKKYIEEMAAEFAASETPLQYATLNTQGQPVSIYRSEEQLAPALAAFAFGPESEGIYGPVLEGNTYTLARVDDSRMMPDSVGARHIVLNSDETAQADSIVKALEGGASFAELAGIYSLDRQTAAAGGDLGVFAPQNLPLEELVDALCKADKGDVFTVTTPYGLHVMELTYKSGLSKKVRLAEITYTIEPSEMTQQTIYADASKFIGEASGSYDNFKEAATKEALSKRVARIRNTDRNVSGLDNSNEVVRWAFNGKEGEVSSILEVDGDYVVAALTGVIEDGIAPVEKVAKEIANYLRFEKKGEMIAQKMEGASSLSEAASKLGAEIKEAAGINFNSFYIDGIGVEPKLIGAVTGVQPGKLSKPVTGGSGVFLFDVTQRENEESATAESEKVRIEASAQAYLNQRIQDALFTGSDIIDNRVRFF